MQILTVFSRSRYLAQLYNHCSVCIQALDFGLFVNRKRTKMLIFCSSEFIYAKCCSFYLFIFAVSKHAVAVFRGGILLICDVAVDEIKRLLEELFEFNNLN